MKTKIEQKTKNKIQDKTKIRNATPQKSNIGNQYSL